MGKSLTKWRIGANLLGPFCHGVFRRARLIPTARKLSSAKTSKFLSEIHDLSKNLGDDSLDELIEACKRTDDDLSGHDPFDSLKEYIL